MSLSTINVLQTNLGRCRAAHDLAYSKALRDDIDILVVAEPNIRKTANGWFRDSRKDVAVMILNKNIQVAEIKAGRGYVGLKLRDLTLFCCYISPNVAFPTYEADLDGLFSDLRGRVGSCVVMGDFNAKAQAWGSPINDHRGEALGDWIAALDLVIINDGQEPTCITPNGQSYIDITAASSDVARKIANWKVHQEESLSTHKYITFGITGLRGARREERKEVSLDLRKCRDLITARANEIATLDFADVDALTNFLLEVKRQGTAASSRRGSRRTPYWWSPEIEADWRQCNAARRRRDRVSARHAQLRVAASEEHSIMRKRLKKGIRRSKREHWRRLLEDLQNDIWGDGYKLVVRELKGFPPNPALTPERTTQILDELFPRRQEQRQATQVTVPPTVVFSREELLVAVHNLKNKKAPGPDGIPAELIKILWEIAPQQVMTLTNDLLAQSTFPEAWKTARLVLIPKPGKDPGSAGAFRPLSLINAMAKLFEALIRNRLVEYLESRALLSERQFGFRKGRATTHAVRTVVNETESTEERWCAFIALDVKNAFNSVSWGRIMDALREKEIPEYLVGLIDSYLSDRSIRTRHGTRVITAGVPQGSVLGPTLWNIVYDGVLSLEVPPGVTLTAYADDLGVLVKANDVAELNAKANTTLRALETWMAENYLELEPRKTEAIILKGPRKRDGVVFTMGGRYIQLKREVKYLGIYLDVQGTFGAHVKHAIEKTEKRIVALSRLLPNVGGPQTMKRRALLGVVHSTLLYGASIWAPALRISRYEKMLVSTQRRMLLRVACAYRTVSAAAVQVLTGTPPIQLLVEERKTLELAEAEDRTQTFKREVKTRMMNAWQIKWESLTDTAEWTRSLIPDVRVWTKCSHRKLSYELTQVLTGHGSFRTYTRRIGKERTDTCWYCGDAYIDTPEHTIISCERWNEEREALRTRLGEVATMAELVRRMIENNAAWKSAQTFIETVMRIKEQEERERQGRARR